EVFAVLRACLGLAGRAGMPKHRLQQGKSCGFHGPYVRLGASTKLERLVDFVNSFYGPSPAMSPQPDTGEVLADLVPRGERLAEVVRVRKLRAKKNQWLLFIRIGE